MKVKRKLKSLFISAVAFVFALSCMWSIAGVVKAAEIDPTQKGTLNITKYDTTKEDGNLLSGATYKVYKIFSLEKTGNKWEYKKESAFNSKLSGVNADALGNYSTAELENLTNDLAEFVADEANSVPVVKEGTTAADGSEKGKVTFSGLDLGYYLVVETKAPEGYVAGKPFLVSFPTTNKDGNGFEYVVNAEPKNSKVDISKDIESITRPGEVVDTTDKATVSVGDIVNYDITTTLPNYDDSYYAGENKVVFTLTDTLSKGLDLQSNTIKVSVDNNEIQASADTYDLTFGTGTAPNDFSFKISFKKEYLKANPGKSVKVTYKTTVNENAITGTTGNNNNMKLEYNNKPNETTTVDVDKKVYSFNINILKFGKDSGTNTPLEGTIFELYTDLAGQAIKTAETDANGNISFEKLAAGTYYLKETKASNGYTLLANPIKVEISHEGGVVSAVVDDITLSPSTNDYTSKIDTTTGTVTIAVENHKGFTLPATGGMGIALFLGVGAVGMLAVAVHMKRKENQSAK